MWTLSVGGFFFLTIYIQYCLFFGVKLIAFFVYVSLPASGLFDEKGKLLGSSSSPIQIWKEGDCVEVRRTGNFQMVHAYITH